MTDAVKKPNHRHADTHEANMKILKDSGLEFTTQDEVCMFRQQRPWVNFWPSTGRWAVVGTHLPQTTQVGGAKAFIEWYKKATSKTSRDQEKERLTKMLLKSKPFLEWALDEATNESDEVRDTFFARRQWSEITTELNDLLDKITDLEVS